jgi:hypothetical protein
MIISVKDPGRQAWIRLWAKILAACCAGVIALVVGILWVLAGFHGLGVDASTAIKLLLGSVLATALAVALMGLMFYSDQTGIDEAVRDSDRADVDESVHGASTHRNDRPTPPPTATSS